MTNAIILTISPSQEKKKCSQIRISENYRKDNLVQKIKFLQYITVSLYLSVFSEEVKYVAIK